MFVPRSLRQQRMASRPLLSPIFGAHTVCCVPSAEYCSSSNPSQPPPRLVRIHRARSVRFSRRGESMSGPRSLKTGRPHHQPHRTPAHREPARTYGRSKHADPRSGDRPQRDDVADCVRATPGRSCAASPSRTCTHSSPTSSSSRECQHLFPDPRPDEPRGRPPSRPPVDLAAPAAAHAYSQGAPA